MLLKKRKKKNKQNGQALTEFVLGLMLIISFFFFYVKMAAVFAIGNYIHYATFMAARAYASSDTSPSAQEANAQTVLTAMLGGRFKAAITPTGGSGTVPGAFIGAGDFSNDDAAEDYWNQGVTFTYQSKLKLYPWSKDSQSIILNLTSESWMPREESAAECNDRLGTTLSDIISKSKAVKLEWDNGC